MSRPPRARRRDSREAVLAAARTEFAARGFSGAGVDRIAARARVNKAMIYYHFGSKLGLYRDVIRESLARLTAELEAATAAAATPTAKIEAYVRGFLQSASSQPHLAAMMLREMAGGGRNLDPETLRRMVGLVRIVSGVLAEGRERGEFRALDPVLTHLMIVGSSLIYVANAPMRERLYRLKPEPGVTVPLGIEPFAQHLTLVLRRSLCLEGEELPGHA
jgi:TetR/AcrR family transcriptional regulator